SLLQAAACKKFSDWIVYRGNNYESESVSTDAGIRTPVTNVERRIIFFLQFFEWGLAGYSNEGFREHKSYLLCSLVRPSLFSPSKSINDNTEWITDFDFGRFFILNEFAIDGHRHWY